MIKLENWLKISLTVVSHAGKQKNAFGEENKAYPKNMSYLIAADPFHQISYSKRIDHLPTKSATEDVKLLEEHRRDYVLP